jgi:acyl carrier protein
MNTLIESQLRDFLAKNILFVEGGGNLANDASFVTEGVIDSIGVTELVEYVRQQFGFEVPLRDITPSNFDSIAGLAGYVRKRLAEDAEGKAEIGKAESRNTGDEGRRTGRGELKW